MTVREDLQAWGTMSNGKLGRTLSALGVAGFVTMGIWWTDPTSECWVLGGCGIPGLQWPAGESQLIGCLAGGSYHGYFLLVLAKHGAKPSAVACDDPQYREAVPISLNVHVVRSGEVSRRAPTPCSGCVSLGAVETWPMRERKIAVRGRLRRHLVPGWLYPGGSGTPWRMYDYELLPTGVWRATEGASGRHGGKETNLDWARRRMEGQNVLADADWLGNSC